MLKVYYLTVLPVFAATPWNDIITDWVSQNIRNWYMHIPVYVDKSGSTGESGMAHEKYGATPGARIYEYDRQDGRCVMVWSNGYSTDEWFEWTMRYGPTPGANMYNSDRQDGRTVIIGGSGIGSDMWFGWLEYYGTVSP